MLYATYSGKDFNKEAFFHSFRKYEVQKKPYIGVMGVRVSGLMEQMIEENIRMDVENFTCTCGRKLAVVPEEIQNLDEDALFLAYADALLGQMPCFRMNNSTKRRALYLDPNLKGIIYHTIKFCDYYGFEYASIKKEIKVPLSRSKQILPVRAPAAAHQNSGIFRDSRRIGGWKSRKRNQRGGKRENEDRSLLYSRN